MARAHEGYDIVTIVDSSVPSKRKERPFYHLFYFAFYKLYGLLTRKSVKHEGITFRLLSRSAALFIVGQYGGELLLKASYIGSAFPALQIDIPGIAQDQPQERSFAQDWRKALRILTATVAPLRIALVASFCAAALSLLYFRVRYPGLFLSALRPRLDDTVASDFRHDAVVFTDIHTPSGICHSDFTPAAPHLGGVASLFVSGAAG